jgi:tRNA threonylcarbamoyl adenosine modification protein YeaZ
MLVLALDTSTRDGAVGWISAPREAPVTSVDDGAESSTGAAPGHAETLVPRIEEVLAAGGHALKDVDLVVFGRGPGSFTGLRVGLATAKGLALARGVPIVGLSSLECLALSSGVDGLVATVVDARRGEIFTAVYEVEHRDGRPSARAVVDEQVLEPAAFSQLIADSSLGGSPYLAGDGVARYPDQLARHGTPLPEPCAAPSACRMAVAGLEQFLTRGADDLATVEPVYLREPDARLPGSG